MKANVLTVDCKTGRAEYGEADLNLVSEAEAMEADRLQRAEDARRERTRRLAACDWTTLPDVPLTTTERDAWAVYRVALRDVTEQIGFPDTIQWPEPPGKIEFTPSGGRSL